MSQVNASAQKPPQPQPQQPWYQIPLIKRAGHMLLLYLFGPMIYLARGKQERTAGRSWQAEERWARAVGSALLSLLWYLPVVILHGQLAAFWSFLFAGVSAFLHLPFLAWLGAPTLFPPLPSNLLLRWVLMLPLTGLGALLLEMIRPQTTWETTRVISPDERLQLEAEKAAQEQKKLKAAARAQDTTTPEAASAKVPRKRRPRPSADPSVQPVTPPGDSLWGRIDWSRVPDTDPLKQMVLHTLAEQEIPKSERERDRWLAQQHQTQTTTPRIVDAAPFPPSPPSPPAPPPPASTDEREQEYNWDEGEGSIQA